MSKSSNFSRLSPAVRIVVLLFSLAIVAILLYFIFRPAKSEVAEDSPVVAVEPVEVRDVDIYGEYVGRINAQQFVEVRARVEGYLQKMRF